jgi:hypothetical protein
VPLPLPWIPMMMNLSTPLTPCAGRSKHHLTMYRFGTHVWLSIGGRL